MTTDPERAANTSGTESVEDEDDNHRKILNSNDVLAALRGGGITAPGFAEQMQSLPAPVKRRVKALKQLQLVTTNIEAKFYEEVHALECEYYKMCAPLYQKRNDIISGTYEPTDEQCAWESDDEEETLTNYMKEKAKIEDTVEIKDEATENEDDIKGIPDFWLTIFKNVSSLSEMVQEHDEPILKHLHDIKVKFLPSNPMGFILEFYFTPNEYFSNSVLTKEYIMKCTPEKNDPFSFEGPEIYKCKGCVIDWKKGKNVTIKTIKKNQKHKSRGSMRTVTKTVQNDSFFNFFSPPIGYVNILLGVPRPGMITRDMIVRGVQFALAASLNLCQQLSSQRRGSFQGGTHSWLRLVQMLRTEFRCCVQHVWIHRHGLIIDRHLERYI
ncbi:nucleosome assembly protein 1-like 4 [Temnothorax curvispinosus]|uniref:Nucleosome assembly protein 1-like 4 n=1 Tax=Temnothorax curvispinosus TaxID=300111 RepID=A0A6J1PXT8_9HYME|nr:nucleosome assembly protein 1-like 4 [Temnothorax curvispinosus]